jgi:hypothetical protein
MAEKVPEPCSDDFGAELSPIEGVDLRVFDPDSKPRLFVRSPGMDVAGAANASHDG